MQKRKPSIKQITALVCLLALSVGAAPNAQKPNILFIAIDDMKPLLGCYGDTIVKSPHIDRLADSGMVFLNNQCQWPVCGPTRASIMSGLMPEVVGVMGFKKMRYNNMAQLKDLVTLPQHFKNNGYETAAIGKVNDPRCVGSINPDGTVKNDGRKVDDPPSWSLPSINPYGVKITEAPRTTDKKKVKLASEYKDLPDEKFSDGATTKEALTRLESLAKEKKPFFLAVGYKKPHLPFLMPKRYWDLYKTSEFPPAPYPYAMTNATPYTFNSIRELRGNYYLETNEKGQALPLTNDILPKEQQQILQHGYYACASFIDAQIGQLLDKLNELGLSDNTIVVLWGDHGWHLGDHNEWGKHSQLEQAARAPLIIRAPGHAKGEKTTSPTEFLDLYPTLCDLAGLPLPTQPMDAKTPTGRPLGGKSLRPILDDPKASVRKGAITMFIKNGAYAYSYRTPRYRYVEWIKKGGEIVAQELYDYQKDPLETINLAGNPEYKKLVSDLSLSMREEAKSNGCERLKNAPPAKK
jgi:arylsulfatase A-like enzyme